MGRYTLSGNANSRALVHFIPDLPAYTGFARRRLPAERNRPVTATPAGRGWPGEYPQKSLRKIQGINDLWILKAALGRPDKLADVDETKLAT